MWARTLWPLLSSTRNIAFGRASTTVPSISITPSFFGMSSTICRSVDYRGPGTSAPGGAVDLVQPPVNLIPGTHEPLGRVIRTVIRAAARHHEADPRWADAPV